MRLGLEAEPINLDRRNELLGAIADGRSVQESVNTRILSIPVGQPTPFEGDQAAFEAAFKGFQESDPGVVALYNRLTGSPGPYWRDLTAQESAALALWTESLRQMDSVSAKYFPTKAEMDVKKAILMVIGVGAILAPLLFTEDEPGASVFPLFPKPSSFLPPGLERAPRGLPAPSDVSIRPGLTFRGPEAAAPAISPRMAPMTRGATGTSGYGAPSRFSRSFAGGGSSSQGAPVAAISHRPSSGAQRFAYPKPRS